MRTKVLFFSRGRGHGHAIPDMAIADELSVKSKDIEIAFASYATGASTFRNARVEVHDLALPEENGFLATYFCALELIKRVKPDIVVAHEEFAALPAAHYSGLPAVFLSAWLPRGGQIQGESLAFASSIIIIGDPGVFPVPAETTVKPLYASPIFRKMKCGVADRDALRAKMGVASTAYVIAVIPGGAISERQSPIFDIVLNAFQSRADSEKRLIWISSRDYALLSQRVAGMPEIAVRQFYDPIEEIISAADVVITRGTRGITLDAAKLGVPTISLSPGTNRIDDILVPRIANNISLNASAVDSSILTHYLERLSKPVTKKRVELEQLIDSNQSSAAEILEREIFRLMRRKNDLR